MGKLSPRTVSMSEYVLCVLCKCATKGSETAKYGCSYPYIRTHSYLQYVLQFYNYSSHPFNPKYVARCILFMSHRVEWFFFFVQTEDGYMGGAVSIQFNSKKLYRLE